MQKIKITRAVTCDALLRATAHQNGEIPNSETGLGALYMDRYGREFSKPSEALTSTSVEAAPRPTAQMLRDGLEITEMKGKKRREGLMPE